MTRVETFPREFNHQFFRDLDREFSLITFVTGIICFTLTAIMAGQPVREMTAEDVKKYTERIYRTTVKPAKVEKAAQETSVGEVAEEVKEEEKEEVIPDANPETEEGKQEIRESKKAQRRSRQELQREKIRAAAQGIKVLGGPTRRVSGSSGTSASREALGLSAGAMGGYDVKKMVGMVGDADKAGKVKALRGGSAISEDIGSIDIEALKTLSLEDIEGMLKGSTVQLNEKAITAKGGAGTKTKQRSPAAISEIVMKNKNQVQYCYWTLKRRDSSLRGRVAVEFTIDPSGAVVRVRFRESNWGGNRLGGDVERCIQNVISAWRFDSIDASGGNVTASATYLFE